MNAKERLVLIKAVTDIDHWGARSRPAARHTAERIVDQIIIPALEQR